MSIMLNSSPYYSIFFTYENEDEEGSLLIKPTSMISDLGFRNLTTNEHEQFISTNKNSLIYISRYYYLILGEFLEVGEMILVVVDKSEYDVENSMISDDLSNLKEIIKIVNLNSKSVIRHKLLDKNLLKNL